VGKSPRELQLRIAGIIESALAPILDEARRAFPGLYFKSHARGRETGPRPLILGLPDTRFLIASMPISLEARMSHWNWNGFSVSALAILFVDLFVWAYTTFAGVIDKTILLETPPITLSIHNVEIIALLV
jgi:hypothetical protein